MEPSGPPTTLHITVVTTADDFADDFNSNQPLRVVFERALTLVGGHSTPDQFRLEYNGETLADMNRRIGEYAEQFGWGDAVQLELVPTPVVV